MDAEKLISLVFARESLWNQAHPDHHNRYILEKKWEEISAVLNLSKDTVKSKWKYLRDTFKKELAKIGKPRSGDAGGVAKESKWSYFKTLLFLKDQFTSRQSTSNLSPALSCTNAKVSNTAIEDEDDVDETQHSDIEHDNTQHSEMHEDNFDSPPTPQSSISSTYTSCNEPRVVLASRKRKKPSDGLGEQLLNVEKQKLQLLQAKSKGTVENKPLDEDRCFFESILPHIKTMHPLKKLQFRSKVQELVMLYAYGEASGNSQFSGVTSLQPSESFYGSTLEPTASSSCNEQPRSLTTLSNLGDTSDVW